jgi:hypothetical protein
LIKLSAPDERSGRIFECFDLVSHESKDGQWWGTNDSDMDHYVEIDFKDMRICPSGYSVKVHSSAWSVGDLVLSWRFEGSRDHEE